MAANSSSTFTRLTTSTGAAGDQLIADTTQGQMALDGKDVGTDILHTDDSDIPTDFMQVFVALWREWSTFVFFFQYTHG